MLFDSKHKSNTKIIITYCNNKQQLLNVAKKLLCKAKNKGNIYESLLV